MSAQAGAVVSMRRGDVFDTAGGGAGRWQSRGLAGQGRYSLAEDSALASVFGPVSSARCPEENPMER